MIFLIHSGTEGGGVGGGVLPVSLPSINNPGYKYNGSQSGSQIDWIYWWRDLAIDWWIDRLIDWLINE